MKRFFCLLFSFACINCAHATPAEVTAGAVVGSVAGVGLNYLAIYGISRAAAVSALAEHREIQEQTEQQRNNSRGDSNPLDTDGDGVRDSEDGCPRIHRGAWHTANSEQQLSRWMFGCPPQQTSQPVTGGFSVSSTDTRN